MNLRTVSRLILMLAVMLASFPFLPTLTDAMIINLKPSDITILSETELYDNYELLGLPAGRLSPLQSVHVVDVDKDWKQDEATDAKWYLVETWLGHKWVKADDRVMSGSFHEENRVITTVFEAGLYSEPKSNTDTGMRLSPQQVKATASITYPQLRGSSALSFSGGGGTWYRIDTSFGSRWLLKPTLLEDVKESPITLDLTLSGEEMSYPYAYHVEKASEPLPAQTLHVTATWDTRSFLGPWGETWYKFKRSDGSGVRWVSPHNPASISYQAIHEVVELPSATRYFENPLLNNSMIYWLEPGTYQAFEASGDDWKHVETPKGPKWVHPKRAMLERPMGVVSVDETIALTLQDTTYRHPILEEPLHSQGYFADQTVHAFEKWDTGTGCVWYHFAGLSMNEWVQKITD